MAEVSGATTGGVLSQIIALGAADTHLTANPEVTFWRARVQKCTNFAYESILQNFTKAEFGNQGSVIMNRTGDLVYWMYILIDLPGIKAVRVPSSNQSRASAKFPPPYVETPSTASDNEIGHCGDPFADEFADYPAEDDVGLDGAPYANWVNEIGHAMIEQVSFTIGGQIIDSVYSHYLHMWEELAGQPGKRLEEMIGKRMTHAQLVADSAHARRLYVPIPFYFTRHSGNALPLVSLQFHSVQIHATFTSLKDLIQVSGPDVEVQTCGGTTIEPSGSNLQFNAQLDTTYIYLDMEERDRFAVGSFQQLITQVQRTQESIGSGTDRMNTNLSFNHPTIELLWAVRRNCHKLANNFFNYSGYGNTDPITKATLSINGLARFSREATFFRLKVPYEAHTNIPRNFIYAYSFALKPEDCQPSGSLNFSRIDQSKFSLTLPTKPDSDTKTGNDDFIMFARNYNILRFREGLGGLMFSN